MAKSTVTFDVTPEKEASQANFFYRQLFICPTAISPREVDLAGKTAIITGANIGLGFESGRQLLDLGLSKLILAVRDESKGEAARVKLLSGNTGSKATIEVWKLDLSYYESVTAFAERAQSLERLDFVILNAALFKVSLELNPRTHHDEVVQVNHLSTSLLAILMLPVLKSKNTPQNPGRMVLLSSETAAWTQFKEKEARPLLPAFDKPETFDMQDRYYTSKLLGQLFIRELTKRVPPTVAVINACNPGLCHGSGLHHETMTSLPGYIFAAFKKIVGRSTRIGARTVVDAAVKHGEESHGQYLGDCKLKPFAPIIYKPQGEEIAEVLWKETMAELSFAGAEEIVRGLSK
ncbi:NAD(P)-binding protein [Biscogniauxia marginata]|nr:NAD(P)-binding protein [Biscogniauxia marginata]